MSTNNDGTVPTVRIPSRRGFASMDKTLARAISSKGGKAAHALKRAHEFTHDEAVAAGRLGGRKMHANRKARAGQEVEQ